MPNQLSVAETLALWLNGHSLAESRFHALGYLADALTVEEVDGDREMLLARASLQGSGKSPVFGANLLIEIAPGQARLTLTLPTALVSGVGEAIAASAQCTRTPMIGGESFVRCAQGAPFDAQLSDPDRSTAVSHRLIFEIRQLWFAVLQVLANANRLGMRTTCAILSKAPIDESAISRACGDQPVTAMQMDTHVDGMILTVVDAFCDEADLRAGLAGLPGVVVVDEVTA